MQPKYRTWRIASIETLFRTVMVAVLASVVLSSAFAQTRGGVLNIGLGYEIDTLNPYSTGRLGDVQATVLEGLVAPDENAAMVPVLALEVPTLENGGIVLSDDGTRMTVTYHLRPGVRWSDGEPFTAADVAFTGHDLRLIPQALAHARRGRNIINQNVVLSIAIIVVLLPLAITGVLGLAAVVLVHEVAEVVVILNGLRAARRTKA